MSPALLVCLGVLGASSEQVKVAWPGFEGSGVGSVGFCLGGGLSVAAPLTRSSVP